MCIIEEAMCSYTFLFLVVIYDLSYTEKLLIRKGEFDGFVFH